MLLIGTQKQDDGRKHPLSWTATFRVSKGIPTVPTISRGRVFAQANAPPKVSSK